MKVVFIILLLIFSISFCHCCLLCARRIPPRPKPLDQFRLPSIKKILETKDAIQQLCGSNSIQASDECKRDVSHLFCSLKEFVDYYSIECPGKEDVEACSTCQRDADEIYQNNSWISTWIDSIGKMPSGISDGNYHWLGDYEQCETLKLDGKFNGHYCMVEFEVPDTVLNTKCDNQPLEIHLGICLPASCKPNETKAIIEDVAQHKMDVFCEPPSEWHTREIIFLNIFVFWCLVILAATGWIWKCGIPEAKSYVDNIVEALSLQHNLRKCLRTTRKREMFHSIDGLQVISLVLLINGNVFFLIMEYLENVSFSYASSEDIFMQPVINYSVYADGLLAFVGFRIGLHVLRKGYTNKIAFWKHLLSRFFRVWPPYAFVTLFVSHIYIRLGYGPMWSHNDLPYRCEKTWWENLLLINNILGYKETCLDGGFLFALEAQFYLIALLIIFIRRRHKAISNALIGMLITCSVAYIFIFTNYKKTYATLIPTAPAFKDHHKSTYPDYVNWIFLSPAGRIAPFLFGLGAPLWCPIKFNPTMKKLVAVFTVLVGAAIVQIIWFPHFVCGINLYIDGSYAALHRSAWAMAIIALAYIIENLNESNVLRIIVSWKLFYPMSKLVFLVFLLSEPVALSLFASLHRPINATFFSIFLTTVGTFVCSYILAVIVEVIITLPFRHLFDFICPMETEPAETAPNRAGSIPSVDREVDPFIQKNGGH